MAHHLRKQQRDAIKATLIAASTNASSRVETARVYPLAMNGTWPQITISGADGEKIGTVGIGVPRLQERAYLVRISAFVKAVDGQTAEDDLDAVGLQIEKALAANITLSGTAKFIRLLETHCDLTEQLEVPAGQLDMIYEVTATAFENAPDVLI